MHKQPTIYHVPSNCSEALQQEKYSWWHDSALLVIARGIQEHRDNVTLYADLPGMWSSENPMTIISENILTVSACPDMVLVREDEVTLIELTIPYNSTESF